MCSAEAAVLDAGVLEPFVTIRSHLHLKLCSALRKPRPPPRQNVDARAVVVDDGK